VKEFMLKRDISMKSQMMWLLLAATYLTWNFTSLSPQKMPHITPKGRFLKIQSPSWQTMGNRSMTHIIGYVLTCLKYLGVVCIALF